MDLISIYIISKNREKFLRRAIDSCLGQTYKKTEIIVVDDCSECFNVMNLKFDYKGKNIRFFRLDKPSGANVCRNLALDNASGQFITGLDDDDYFHPSRLEVMRDVYVKRKTKVSAVSSRHVFDSACQGRGLWNWLKYSLKDLTRYLERGRLIGLSDILNRNHVGNHVFTEKQRLIEAGGFDDHLPALQDYETWIRLMKNFGPIYRVNEFLYIKNDELISITNINRNKLRGFDYIFKKHLDIFEGKEHCFTLHKLLYKQKYITLGQVLHLARAGNFLYIVYLALTLKVKLR